MQNATSSTRRGTAFSRVFSGAILVAIACSLVGGCNAIFGHDRVFDDVFTDAPEGGPTTPSPSTTLTPSPPDRLPTTEDGGLEIIDANVAQCDANLSIDTKNCGVCGFDCNGDACANSRCENDLRFLVVDPPVRDDGEQVNLTATGPLDWGQWQNTALSRCANCGGGGGGQRIGVPSFGPAGTTLNPYADDDRTFSWTNGTPNATGSTTSGFFVAGIGKFFELRVASNATRAVLTYYIDTSNSGGRLVVSFANLPIQQFTTPNLVGGARYRVKVHFADPANRPLIIQWQMVLDALGQPYDNVAIIAATLAPDT
jgi:hypothetical protein